MAEISALGLELISDYPKGCKYADMNGEHQPPSFAGVKMKRWEKFILMESVARWKWRAI